MQPTGCVIRFDEVLFNVETFNVNNVFLRLIMMMLVPWKKHHRSHRLLNMIMLALQHLFLTKTFSFEHTWIEHESSLLL